MWRAASNLWGDKGSLAGMWPLFAARGGRRGVAHSGKPFEDKAMGLYLKRLPRAFRRLHWRFALSYMLVTVCSVALVPATYFIASYLFVVRSPSLPRDMAAGLEPVASQTLPYLVQVPTDQAGLHDWLVHFNSDGRLQGVDNFADLWMSGPPDGTSVLTVVDSDGRVVASSAPVATLAPGTVLAPGLSQAGQGVLRAALAGDKQTADLATPLRDGRSVIAVPITIPGRTMGALVLDMDVLAAQRSYIPKAVLGLFGFIAIVTILAGLIGLVFGFIISRGLTRRLGALASAAKSWSRGDFAATARDPSGDELGELARDLNRMAEQIQTLLAARQELAVVDERNRLARDLHDSVKQQVFAASMQVAAARALMRSDPATAESRLDDVERLVAEAQRELTGLIRELRPVALADKGLVPALRTYCADWSRGTSIAAEVRALGERPAPLEIEQALFRVAQEALANIARHSGAAHVEVQVRWESAALLLSITDDGHGFDVAAAHDKGVGLQSMRERVEGIGGSLEIRRAGLTGMCVEACVPMAKLTLVGADEDGAQALASAAAPAER